MSRIVNKVGLIYIEALGTHSKLDDTKKQVVQNKLPAVIALSFKYLDQEFASATMNIVEFVNSYLWLLKRIELQPYHFQTVQELLAILIKRMQYLATYFKGEDAGLVEESFASVRNELTTLFVNLVAIPSLQRNLVEYVGQLVAKLKAEYKVIAPAQKEVIMYLLYRLGQGLKGVRG